MIPGSPEAIEAAELLEAMAGIYPGDVCGNLTREACELRGIPYEPPVVIVTYHDEPHPARDERDESR